MRQALVTAVTVLALQMGTQSQEGHPLSGTWTGNWGPTAAQRTHLTVVMSWDGKAVTGLINPGPDASPLSRVTVDWAAWTVRLEADGKDASGKPAPIRAEGRLEDIGSSRRRIVGTWTHGAVTGDVRLTLGDASPILRAQRSFSATYDDDRQIRLEGLITRVEWVNPRAYLLVDARDGAGVRANWAVEIGNLLDLERSGWHQGTVRPGDLVVISGNPAKGTALRAYARAVTLKRTGARVFAVAAPTAATSSEPLPRWPNGRVRLGAAPGQKGYWGAASARALVESSAAKAAMNDEGLLANLSDAERVAPFQPWANAVYLYRQRTLLADDPVGRCLPPGGPRQFHSAAGFQFVEQPELGRILVLLGGGNRNWRVIYTDGRPVGQSAEAVPSYYGYSVGRWEKDTLVVESVGYNERFWMTNGGLPHTEALRLVERFTRTDVNRLRYEVTVDDPRTYTRPWTGGWTIQWVAGKELPEYFCEENAESTFAR